jgi:hypothetical protein
MVNASKTQLKLAIGDAPPRPPEKNFPNHPMQSTNPTPAHAMQRLDTLPDAENAQRGDRNESARARLQPQTRNSDSQYYQDDEAMQLVGA